MSQKLPRIMLSLDRGRQASRSLFKGIAHYAHLHGPWQFVTRHPFYQSQSGRISRRRFDLSEEVDGIITYLLDQKELEILHRFHIPAVIIWMNKEILPNETHILGENEKIGQMAAEHLLEKNLHTFGFCGLNNLFWSNDRFEGFRNALQKNGIAAENIKYYTPLETNKTPAVEQKRLIKWLHSLRKPAGVMAWNDEMGEQVIRACLQADISVPEQIAVIGVDNDELICDFLDIPLSSIELNFTQAGYEAAELLDAMLKGTRLNDRHAIIRPIRIVQRKSTDILAGGDPDVVAALRYIQEHTSKKITVADVAAHTATSRRTLQKKFKAFLGRSVHSEITRVRIEKAKRLLEETKLNIGQIAAILDYSDITDFNRSFRHHTSVTPTEYRSQFQTL